MAHAWAAVGATRGVLAACSVGIADQLWSKLEKSRVSLQGPRLKKQAKTAQRFNICAVWDPLGAELESLELPSILSRVD